MIKAARYIQGKGKVSKREMIPVWGQGRLHGREAISALD